MNPTVGAFVAQAGSVPGVSEEEYQLVLPYTEEQLETDQARAAHDRTTFADLRDEALEHTRQLVGEGRLKWVRFEFVRN